MLKAKHHKYKKIIAKTLNSLENNLNNDPKFTEKTDDHFTLSSDAVGYLMANNLNYASFNNK